MHTTLEKIYSKPTDYKVCKECNCYNWYENKECHSCPSTDFDKLEEEVILQLESDYEFYKNDGYTKTEIDNIEVGI